MQAATTVVHRLEEVAREGAKRPALTFGADTYTYGELLDGVNRCVGGLADLGVAPGDRVAIMVGNWPEYFVASHAIWKLGAIQVPVNASYREDETAYVLSDSEATCVFVSPATRTIVEAVRDDLAGLEHVVHVRPEEGLEPSFRALLGRGSPGVTPPTRLEDELAVIAYTSGTTGRPKGAMLDHRHLVDSLSIGCEYLGLGRDDPVLQGLPAFHNNSSLNGVFLAWWAGSHAVLLERFVPEALTAAVVDHDVAFFVAVATVLHDIAGLPPDVPVDFSSVRYVIFGGSPTPPHVRRAVEDRFGLRMIQAYGMTEATYIAMDPTEGDIVHDASGRPLPHNELHLLDDDLEPVGRGDIGEICLSAPEEGDAAGRTFRPIRGYWKKPEATEEAFAGGVFHTGDLGYVDEHGFLHVVDRKKDMIIRGGTNIYPAELERVLMEDERVAEAYVVGVPDERLGEVPKAFVVAADGVEVDTADLARSVNERMAKYKRIEGVDVVAREHLPRNAMGKVLKRELRARERPDAPSYLRSTPGA